MAHQAEASRRTDVTLSVWKAVPDWLCTALQAVVWIGAISPAHPRFSRMYGVTNSTVFQTAFVLATVLLMSIAKNLL